MPRVEGSLVHQPIRSLQSQPLIARQRSHHPSIRIDRRGDARVGVPQQPAMVLHRSHPGLIQMLPTCAGVPIPSIVRDVDEDLSPMQRKLPHLMRKDRLIADEHAIAVLANIQRHALTAG